LLLQPQRKEIPAEVMEVVETMQAVEMNLIPSQSRNRSQSQSQSLILVLILD
jgi:hypothetical protein